MKDYLKEINERLGAQKNSRRRSAVIRAFSSSEAHLTVDEIYERARKIDSKIGYTTVWRTMKLLESSGLAFARKFHDGQTRYEHRYQERHHDHLICIDCGRVEEFFNDKIEDTQKQVASRHGFLITSHKMELYGYCNKCKGMVKNGVSGTGQKCPDTRRPQTSNRSVHGST